LSIEPIFFRIDIESMSGLKGVPEAEKKKLSKRGKPPG
jgi:hypothetical protein